MLGSYLCSSLLLTTLAFSKPLVADHPDPLIVQTTSGTVRGFVDTNSTNVTLNKWYGIRFAADTSGENRWRPPQPYFDGKDVFNASAFGPACLQGRADGGNGTSIQSEDCLRINVIAPEGAKNLPVYLYS